MNSFVVALPRETTAAAFHYDVLRLLAVAPRLVAQLAAVKAPPADASRYAQLQRANIEQIGLVREGLIAASQGSLKGVREAGRELAALSRRYNRVADAIGLRTCAKNVVPSSSRKPPPIGRASST